MKKAYGIVFALFLSCGILKAPCKKVQLGNTEAIAAQSADTAVLLLYSIQSGELKDYQFQVIRGNSGKYFSVNVVHPELKEKCKLTPNSKLYLKQEKYSGTDSTNIDGEASLTCR